MWWSAGPAGFAVVLMYVQGNHPVRHHDAGFEAAGCIFSQIVKPTLWRYVSPASRRHGAICAIPLVYHRAIAFTNYSGNETPLNAPAGC